MKHGSHKPQTPTRRCGPRIAVVSNRQPDPRRRQADLDSRGNRHSHPALHRGNPPPALAFNDVKDMQVMLARSGFDVGSVDGFIGLKTRQAVKATQLKYGLPADSYPTAELLARMRAAR